MFIPYTILYHNHFAWDWPYVSHEDNVSFVICDQFDYTLSLNPQIGYRLAQVIVFKVRIWYGMHGVLVCISVEWTRDGCALICIEWEDTLFFKKLLLLLGNESAFFFLWRWKSNWPWALHEHHPYTFCILVTLRTKGYAVIHSCTWWALSRSEFPIYIIDASELTPLEQQSWPRNSSIVFCSLLNILFECCVTFLFCFVSQAYS